MCVLNGGGSGDDLYSRDECEQPCWLFMCPVGFLQGNWPFPEAGSDRFELIITCTSWLRPSAYVPGEDISDVGWLLLFYGHICSQSLPATFASSSVRRSLWVLVCGCPSVCGGSPSMPCSGLLYMRGRHQWVLPPVLVGQGRFAGVCQQWLVHHWLVRQGCGGCGCGAVCLPVA